MIVLAACIIAGVACILVGLSWWYGNRVLTSRFRAAVIVTLRSGAAFRGVLVDADRNALVLRNAEAVEKGSSTPVPVDGEVLILRPEVEFIQRP